MGFQEVCESYSGIAPICHPEIFKFLPRSDLVMVNHVFFSSVWLNLKKFMIIPS